MAVPAPLAPCGALPVAPARRRVPGRGVWGPAGSGSLPEPRAGRSGGAGVRAGRCAAAARERSPETKAAPGGGGGAAHRAPFPPASRRRRPMEPPPAA